MHTIIRPPSSLRNRNSQSGIVDDQKHLRTPHYECQDRDNAVEITAFVPGVEAPGVEIAASGPDLMITARKSRFVRVNFQSLHLENAQRDYRLVLRLGNGLAFGDLAAEIRDGILTLRIPKKDIQPLAGNPLALSQVA
ncbi:MAG: Hsp20/alpha crystallin family protein [Opitutaceae bacterium]|nr:Hsp20/alpha crystallin family protein [Opitutaceae bacterium]